MKLEITNVSAILYDWIVGILRSTFSNGIENGSQILMLDEKIDVLQKIAPCICDQAWENRAYVHTKFDHIFEFQTSITLLIKIVI